MTKDYAKEARKCRRYARLARGFSTTFYILGAAFVLGGIWIAANGGSPLMIFSAFIMIINAAIIRTSAGGFDDSAKTWDRLAQSRWI